MNVTIYEDLQVYLRYCWCLYLRCCAHNSLVEEYEVVTPGVIRVLVHRERRICSPFAWINVFCLLNNTMFSFSRSIPDTTLLRAVVDVMSLEPLALVCMLSAARI